MRIQLTVQVTAENSHERGLLTALHTKLKRSKVSGEYSLNLTHDEWKALGFEYLSANGVNVPIPQRITT